MTTIPTTQCLQHDSAHPIGLHYPLPNLLPVGDSSLIVVRSRAQRGP